MSSLEQLRSALADRYTLERELGSGGMATVYLAEDLKHKRKVAIKVLKPELTAVLGAERFVQEITTTAALQHPHILPLFDSGTAYGPDKSGPYLYYVMPFIDGETLRAKLDRETQLGIDESVRIASDVASALHYAHEHGVIHRDIKPENILLHEGRPMVADFGIALAVSAAAGGRMTETGLSLGTPHYMSPEQATAEKEITARSDIYSVGSVLYEMLTGNPPHTGASAQQIIMKIVTEEAAAVTKLRKSVPPNVAAAVAKALEKLPADRFASAKAFAEALTDPSFTGGQGTGATHAAHGPSRPRARLAWVLLTGAVGLIGILATLLWRRPPPPSGDVVRAILELPKGTEISYPSLSLSRDGSRIVVSARQAGQPVLLQRPLNQLEFSLVAGSEDGARQFLSPDGKWVAFGTATSMRKVPLEGGQAVEVTKSPWAGGDWTADNTIYYTPTYVGGLWRVPAGGGTPQQLSTRDTTTGELAHWWPQLLPDGEHLLFTAFRTPIDSARIEVLSLKTGQRTMLLTGGISGRYVSTGHLLYARGEALFAVPFDLGRLEVTGQPVPVVEDVAVEASDGRAGFAVSDNGTLAYLSATSFNTNLEMIWVDRRGTTSEPITAPGRYQGLRLSPDGRKLALDLARPGETRDVWILDLVRGTRTPLTSGGANDFAPLFTPEGTRVVFESERPVFDLYIRATDASGPATPLVVSSFDKVAGSITADGKTLLFTHSLLPHAQVWTVPLDGSGSPTFLLGSESGSLASPTLAPNQQWLAYVSEESGRGEVYLTRYPDVTNGRRLVSASGGVDPRWTKGGRELTYRNGREMIAVSVNPATGELGTPTTLFAGDFWSHSNAWSHDVTPDGERFLMLRRPAGTEPRQVIVVTNWFQELKRLVPN